MPDYKDPRKEDIVYGDRRLSRPDTDFPDWYIPDAKYRPIPIAWFAAAVILQTAVISVLYFMLIGKSGWVTIVLATLASAGILSWSWARGINNAGSGWQFATVAVMLMQLGFICAGVSDRL